MEGEIVFDFAGDRASGDVDGGVGWETDVDIARVSGEFVVTVIGEHAGVGDDSVGGVDFDVGSADVLERNRSGHGTDFDVAVDYVRRCYIAL